MTTTDLDAIRARLEASPRLRETNEWSPYVRIPEQDAHALLAEVERLRAEVTAERAAVVSFAFDVALERRLRASGEGAAAEAYRYSLQAEAFEQLAVAYKAGEHR